MNKERTFERDLLLPALQALAESERADIGLSTKELAQTLRRKIVPTAKDMEKLPSRNDDRLSQVIRNLISHRTLERKGLAIYHKDLISGVGYYRLTELGKGTLLANYVDQKLPTNLSQ